MTGFSRQLLSRIKSGPRSKKEYILSIAYLRVFVIGLSSYKNVTRLAARSCQIKRCSPISLELIGQTQTILNVAVDEFAGNWISHYYANRWEKLFTFRVCLGRNRKLVSGFIDDWMLLLASRLRLKQGNFHTETCSRYTYDRFRWKFGSNFCNNR